MEREVCQFMFDVCVMVLLFLTFVMIMNLGQRVRLLEEVGKEEQEEVELVNDQEEKVNRLWSAYIHDYKQPNFTSMTCVRCLKHRDDPIHRFSDEYKQEVATNAQQSSDSNA